MNYEYEYPRPALAVDLLIFRGASSPRELLLIERKHDPFAGRWALPGGFLDENETLEEAASRELLEETGLRVSDDNLCQLKAYSTVDRDPRTRVISVVFVANVPAKAELQAGDDAADAKWFRVDELPELAFDHEQIVNDGLSFLASDAEAL